MTEPVEDRLAALEAKVDRILVLLETMSKDTNLMGEHISFVEGVYDQIKSPFHRVMGAVDSLSIRRVLGNG